MTCCCNKTLVSFFLKQLFSFGYNCGSLISEGIGLIRTFQRICAPGIFIAKLSPDCIKCFNWAQEIINFFLRIVNTNPLNQFENYYLYTLVFPLTILMAFSFITNDSFFKLCFIYGLFLMAGYGIGVIQYNYIIALIILAIPIVIFIIGFIITKCSERNCCCDCNCKCFDLFSKENNDEYQSLIDNAQTFIWFCLTGPPLLNFYLLMTPIMLERTKLLHVISIMAGIFVGLFCVIPLLYIWLGNYFCCCCPDCDCCFDGDIGDSISIGNILVFITYCLTLLIIPSANKFLSYMNSSNIQDWRAILSYIAISILLPISIIIILIKSNHSLIVKKYKDSKRFFYYIELIDIIRQLVYSILAYYDIVWICLALEVLWAIFILIARPYQEKSEYVLTIGNCIITSISNSATIYAIQKDIKLNFAITIFLIIIVILPAVISMIVYFSCDLSFDEENDVSDECLETIGNFIKKITPFAWLFFGMNLPILKKVQNM